MTLSEVPHRPTKRELGMSLDDISLNEMWVKVGIGGSAVWSLFLYLWGDNGLNFKRSDFDFYPCPWQTLHHDDDSLPLILGGWFVIWLLSFLFIRKKPTD